MPFFLRTQKNAILHPLPAACPRVDTFSPRCYRLPFNFAMEYKDTLNLPRTDFPMKADLITREPARLQKWEAAQLYSQIQSRRNGREKFVLHDGPPFANGDVHVGTALNKILKDIIIKYKSLRGFSALHPRLGLPRPAD